MAAPAPSKLDHQQCIQGSFDEATGRLRVDAQLSSTIITPPGLEVSILAVYDNIAIRNSNNNNELLINADGSINVTGLISIDPNSSINLNQVAGISTAVNNGIANNGTQRVVIASDNDPITVSIVPKSIFSQFDSITSVSSGILTTILSHTATSTEYINLIEVSGDNIAQYEIYINGVLNARQRTYFGGNLNTFFNYSLDISTGYLLNIGDILLVRVIHNRPTVGAFEARLLYAT